MKLDYFYEVAENMDSYKYLSNLEENILFIYSPTSIEKVNITNRKIKMENWHNISKDIQQIERYIENLSSIKEIVTFGGGSTIDIGKYISNILNVKYTCIPSMLSTNSYATNKVALIKNGSKITLGAKMPDRIIIDDQLLKLSKNENLYGLADVLSIYTALYDWEIAEKDIKEKINYGTYNKAENLLNEVLEFVRDNSLENIIESNMQLFKFIGIAGYITNLYGTGRPESGSEHILAKEIEKKINVPHGMSVSIGILIMSLLQERNLDNVLDAIIKMGILNNCNKYGLTKDIITESFFNVKPRDDRYTIINRYVNNQKGKELVIENFWKVMNERKINCL